MFSLHTAKTKPIEVKIHEKKYVCHAKILFIICVLETMLSVSERRKIHPCVDTDII